MQNLGDTFGQVFRAIWSNKLRSFLTMFGIAWGVGSMLLLVSVGEGFRSGTHRELASFGNDLIMMWAPPSRRLRISIRACGLTTLRSPTPKPFARRLPMCAPQ